MNKEKFKFNQKTYQFEKVEVSVKQKFKQLGIHSGLSLVIALVFIVLSYPVVSRIIGRQQIAEIEKLKSTIKYITNQFEPVLEDLAVLQLRDDSLYSGIYGVEPIAQSLRLAGTGGVDKTSYLEGFENSKLMISSAKQLHELEAKLTVHKERFEAIAKLSKSRSLKLATVPAVQPIHNHNLIRTSSGFGMRIHPVYHVKKMHTGIDFTAKKGTKIYATGDGVIKEAVNSRTGYGKHVVIKHGFGYQTLYAHMSGFAVKKGQKVSRGQLIGYVGNTGTSTGCHLHYEVIKDGRKINPANFFFNDLTYGEFSELVKIGEGITTSLD
ncbi:MAG: murein DD-endopeptidase MepM/ murein hydrolase activator NlpD [Saprospiraceae bacterium]|jgi:murein DD-endopeptidase MepM/ murein hydrolase activator NlpD